MSEPEPGKPRGAVSFECKLRRVEAWASVEHAEMDVTWRVSAMPAGEDFPDRGSVYLHGHLVVGKPRLWGQVLVAGLATRRDPFSSPKSFEAFVHKYAIGFVEEMYDVARRSLEINAALMDGDFDLPKAAPVVTIRVAHPEGVTQPPLVTERADEEVSEPPATL